MLLYVLVIIVCRVLRDALVCGCFVLVWLFIGLFCVVTSVVSLGCCLLIALFSYFEFG